jgi:hypothetical protein
VAAVILEEEEVAVLAEVAVPAEAEEEAVEEEVHPVDNLPPHQHP